MDSIDIECFYHHDYIDDKNCIEVRMQKPMRYNIEVEMKVVILLINKEGLFSFRPLKGVNIKLPFGSVTSLIFQCTSET